MPSLAEQIAANPVATAVLEGFWPHSEAVRRIRKCGIPISEKSVRRLRTDAGWKPSEEREETKPPKDMPAFTEYEGPNGRAALHLPRQGFEEHDLLREAGFDPDSWRIKGHVNTRKWMRYDQEWLFYYKFDVEQGESKASVKAHVSDLAKHIRKRRKPGIGFWNLDNPRTYVHVIADWQIGKAEGGRGTAHTVARYRECLQQAKENIIALRKSGVLIETLAIVSTGDLVEGCGDHYAMQQFSVDCDRREQNRIVRELLTDTILTLAPMFMHTFVAVIGGNHGENRKEGKAYTTFADNDDVGAPEAVMEAFHLAGWEGKITWYIPDDELSMNIELSGVNLGLVHGHQFKGGVNALKKAEDWWRANDFGLQPVRDSQILLSGHFHHFVAVNVAHGRSWIQAPTIDPGSKWYTDTSGVTAIPGVLNFVIDPSKPLGYDYLRVLHPSDDVLTS